MNEHPLYPEFRPGRRYGLVQMFTAHEWEQHSDLITERFKVIVADECADKGYPPPPDDQDPKVTGLRINSEGSRNDRGELPSRIACDPTDPRTIEIEISMRWSA